jgi:hypothetical protein
VILIFSYLLKLYSSLSDIDEASILCIMAHFTITTTFAGLRVKQLLLYRINHVGGCERIPASNNRSSRSSRSNGQTCQPLAHWRHLPIAADPREQGRGIQYALSKLNQGHGEADLVLQNLTKWCSDVAALFSRRSSTTTWICLSG